jgi:hypothetical protein
VVVVIVLLLTPQGLFSWRPNLRLRKAVAS